MATSAYFLTSPNLTLLFVHFHVSSLVLLAGLSTACRHLMQATSLSTVDTLYSADAVEFCPGNSRLFAVGTYQIEKDESAVPVPVPKAAADDSGDEDDAPLALEPVVTRYGRCLLYEIDEEGSSL